MSRSRPQQRRCGLPGACRLQRPSASLGNPAKLPWCCLSQCSAESQIGGCVDLRAGMLEDNRLPGGAETAAAFPEGCHVHGVDRPGFQVGGFEVLAALAGLLRVMVDAAAIAPPEEAVPGGDGKAAVHRRCIQGRQHLIDLLTAGERRGALQKHQLRIPSHLFQRLLRNQELILR